MIKSIVRINWPSQPGALHYTGVQKVEPCYNKIMDDVFLLQEYGEQSLESFGHKPYV